MLNEHLENLIKAEIPDKTVLNTKGTELTPKLSMDMVSPPQKLLLEAYSHQFLTQTQGKDFGILGAYQGKETSVRYERWDRLFIGKVCHQLSDRAMEVQQP
jgi:hypothetical protein